MQCLARRVHIFVIIVATISSKWRPALAQLYRIAALSSATKAMLYRSIDILSERGRLSGPFPSARCSDYCFRERPHLPLSSAFSLAEREWKQQKKKKKKQTAEWIFQQTVTPDYLVRGSLLFISFVVVLNNKGQVNIFETFYATTSCKM